MQATRSSSALVNKQGKKCRKIDMRYLYNALKQQYLQTTDILPACSGLAAELNDVMQVRGDINAVISEQTITRLATWMQPDKPVEVAVAAMELATSLGGCIGHACWWDVKAALATGLESQLCGDHTASTSASAPASQHDGVQSTYRRDIQSICQRLVSAVSPNILSWLQQGGQGGEAALAFVAIMARACRVGQPPGILQAISGLLSRSNSPVSTLTLRAFGAAAAITEASVSMHEYGVERLGLPAVGPMSHDFAAEIDSSENAEARRNLMQLLLAITGRSVAGFNALERKEELGPDCMARPLPQSPWLCQPNWEMTHDIYGLAAMIPKFLAELGHLISRGGDACEDALGVLLQMIHRLHTLPVKRCCGPARFYCTYRSSLLGVTRQQQFIGLCTQLRPAGVLDGLRQVT